VTATGKLQIPGTFSRSAVGDERWERESAIWLINRVCEQVGWPDLSETEVLDMGCGIKFTKVFVNEGVPVKRYVGIDVFRDMIEYLKANVGDPRFEYFHVNVKNDLYNPSGEPFTEDLRLPVDGRRFDLICLFSVFTHLPPDDYRAMLKVLRHYVRPEGRLFFTLYINELTAGGHGLIDAWGKKFEGREDEVMAQAAVRRAQGLADIEPFVDLVPSKRLKWAVYSREYAHELIEGTGWRALQLSDPDVYIQHHFVCAPV
jgi:SAM-dependent methyltransferase